ncbi:MAG: hypothetical protein Q9181_001621 [Wetmoreana brouardii]
MTWDPQGTLNGMLHDNHFVIVTNNTLCRIPYRLDARDKIAAGRIDTPPADDTSYCDVVQLNIRSRTTRAVLYLKRMQGRYDQSFPPSISSRIQVTIQKYPELDALFRDIAAHIQSTSNTAQTNGETHAPVSKKRKLEANDDGYVPADDADTIADVSFSIPQRKKLKLELGRNAAKGQIRGLNAAGEAEFGIRWTDVDYVVCLPVPEKAQSQHSFCVLPKEGEEQILFTVPGTTIKPGSVKSSLPVGPEETYKEITTRMLNERLKTKVVEPNDKDFVSQVAQAHRKGEKAVHVKAHRGSKDGFLFFLPIGIIFAFKKPLSLFPFHKIASVSYTSVLQRTFDLVISVYNSSPSSSADNDTQEIEFAMIDQGDFAGIDAYVKRHGLQDASMAEQRRAKKLNVNGVKDEEADGEEGGELQKAQREAQDLEDEDEEEDENFDPGSEGESEGSGESSEEEGGDGTREGDLVADELGSEAEEVSE